MAIMGASGWVQMIHIKSGSAVGCWCVKGAQFEETTMASPLMFGFVKGLEKTSKPRSLRENSLEICTSCIARKFILLTAERYEVREDSRPLAPLQLKDP